MRTTSMKVQLLKENNAEYVSMHMDGLIQMKTLYIWKLVDATEPKFIEE